MKWKFLPWTHEFSSLGRNHSPVGNQWSIESAAVRQIKNLEDKLLASIYLQKVLTPLKVSRHLLSLSYVERGNDFTVFLAVLLTRLLSLYQQLYDYFSEFSEYFASFQLRIFYFIFFKRFKKHDQQVIHFLLMA